MTQILCVSDETLRVWDLEGFLRAELRMMQNIRHYTVGAIDALLRNGARNFAVTPTTMDLLSGRLTLVQVESARAETGGISESVMFDRVESGRIAVVKLRRELRYSLQSIQQYNAGSLATRTDLIPRKIAMHILGISEPLLKTLIRDGVLVCDTVVDNLHFRPVTNDSFVVLLQELLPPWIDPADWMEDRLLSDKPIVRATAAMRMLEEDSAGLNRLMQERKLQYIYTPSRIQRQFLPESLAFYLAHLPILRQEDVALQFGVRVSSVRKWCQQGLLVCPAPGHAHGGEWSFNKACLIAILRTCLSPKIPVNQWYRLRLEGKMQLLGAEQMARAIGVKYNDVVALAEAGELAGIRSPRGIWHFTERQARRVKGRLGERR